MRKASSKKSVRKQAHQPAEQPQESRALRLRTRPTPRNQSQREFLSLIDNRDLVFGLGPAGTGKTYLAVFKAAEALIEKRVDKIILVRPAVEAGEKLGYLPGTMQEKIDPYLKPLYDALDDMLGAEKVKFLIAKGVIEAATLAFMRGRTFKDCFVLCDEAQNATLEQMTMLLTRFGEGSKMVVTGDASQVDLQRNQTSGLAHASNKLKRTKGVGVYEFASDDIVRHELVLRIVEALQ